MVTGILKHIWEIKLIVTKAKCLTTIDYNSRKNIYIIMNTSTRAVLSVERESMPSSL